MITGSVPAQPTGSARVVVSANDKVVRVFEGKPVEDLEKDATEFVNFLKAEGKSNVTMKRLNSISG